MLLDFTCSSLKQERWHSLVKLLGNRGAWSVTSFSLRHYKAWSKRQYKGRWVNQWQKWYSWCIRSCEGYTRNEDTVLKSAQNCTHFNLFPGPRSQVFWISLFTLSLVYYFVSKAFLTLRREGIIVFSQRTGWHSIDIPLFKLYST